MLLLENKIVNLAELIFSLGQLLRVAASSGVSPGMIDTVDDGSRDPLPNLLLHRVSGYRIKAVGEIPVGLIVLVKRHLLSSLISGGSSNVNNCRAVA